MNTLKKAFFYLSSLLIVAYFLIGCTRAPFNTTEFVAVSNETPTPTATPGSSRVTPPVAVASRNSVSNSR